IAGGIDTDAICYRFMPHRLRGEGLFLAILLKPGENRGERQQSKNKTKSAKATPQLTSAKSWLTDEASSEMEIYADDDRINAFPRLHADTLRKIKKELDVIHEGVLIGNVKGRDLIPSQSLALSPCLRKDAFPTVEIDSRTAISYLSGDAITLPEGTPRGFVLLTNRQRPLGFVKNIGNRSNNLYPAPWRIKSKIN
ncbi:MAG: rRNA cytosine-C5-methyltransferase, partial [Duncaniella sp.]|nr:rRNA cytosine-C5-methyltransferase [Duncaniella sp.]